MHFSPHLKPKTFNDFNIKGLLLCSSFGQETFGIQLELNLSSSHTLLKIWKLTGHNAYVLVQKKVGDTNSVYARGYKKRFFLKIIRPFQ